MVYHLQKGHQICITSQHLYSQSLQNGPIQAKSDLALTTIKSTKSNKNKVHFNRKNLTLKDNLKIPNSIIFIYFMIVMTVRPKRRSIVRRRLRSFSVFTAAYSALSLLFVLSLLLWNTLIIRLMVSILIRDLDMNAKVLNYFNPTTQVIIQSSLNPWVNNQMILK